MKRQFGLILSFAFILFVSAHTVQAQSDTISPKQEEQPVVTKAVAPHGYPPIAVAVKAEGKVIVEVTLNAQGEVKGARAVAGHPLLQNFAATTARRWQFAPTTEDSKERSARLTFIFRLVSREDQEATSFNPPYEVEYAVVPPKYVQTVNY